MVSRIRNVTLRPHFAGRLRNLALAITLSQSAVSWAMNAMQANNSAVIAVALSGIGEQWEAYLQLVQVLDDAKPEIQRIAMETLKAHPAIANQVLSEISFHSLAVKTCRNGLTYTELEAQKTLRHLNAFADERISTGAAKVTDGFFAAAKIDRLEERCAPVREQERERLLENKVEIEERSRIRRRVLEEVRSRILTKNAPTLAANLDRLDFCVKYGIVLRGENPEDFGKAQGLLLIFDNEAKKRKIRFNKKLVESRKIRIGMTDCELLAAWGYPSDTNRSVGSWGAHVQHVYGRNGPYVYTENGIVKAFQD